MDARKELLREIAAFLAGEYPDINIDALDDNGALSLESCGDCAGCPFDCLSKEKGVSAELLRRFPEITSVKISPAISDELLDAARQMLRRA